MLVTTKAIVLSKVKLKEADLIVKCYTQNFGIKSYILKGVLKSKRGKIKAAYFQNLSLIEIEANHKNNKELQYLREVKLAYNLITSQTNVIKSTIILFLSEILGNILKEEEENLKLFEFIETSLIWFEEQETYSSFHLVFLLELTKYLGFYPEIEDSEAPYFDLLEGRTTELKIGHYSISGDNLIMFKQVLGIKFDVNKKLNINSKQKQEILDMILLYFELHLDGFKKPRSREVLNQVFS
jgi:DNA repair protein RecO (recombination protein O)